MKSLEELHLLFHKLEFETAEEFIRIFHSIEPVLEADKKTGLVKDDNKCPWLQLVDSLRDSAQINSIVKRTATELISLWKQQRSLSTTDISNLFKDYFCIAMAMSIASLSRHNLQILTEQMLIKRAAEDEQKNEWGHDA